MANRFDRFWTLFTRFESATSLFVLLVTGIIAGVGAIIAGANEANWRIIVPLLVLAAAILLPFSVCVSVLLIKHFLREDQVLDKPESGDAPGKPQLDFIQGKRFQQQSVPIDGKNYVGCQFEDVTFVVNGAPYSFTHNHLNGKIGFQTDNAEIFGAIVFLHGLGWFKDGVPILDASGNPRENTTRYFEVNDQDAGS